MLYEVSCVLKVRLLSGSLVVCVMWRESRGLERERPKGGSEGGRETEAEGRETWRCREERETQRETRGRREGDREGESGR